MKKIVSVCLISSMLFGTGCADYGKYSDSIATTNLTNSNTVTSYFQSKSQIDGKVLEVLGKTNERGERNDMALVLYAILSKQNDEDVLKNFRAIAPEKPKTGGDVAVALVNVLPGLATVGGLAYSSVKIVDSVANSAGTKINVNGDGNATNVDSFKSGFGNSNVGGSVSGSNTNNPQTTINHNHDFETGEGGGVNSPTTKATEEGRVETQTPAEVPAEVPSEPVI